MAADESRRPPSVRAILGARDFLARHGRGALGGTLLVLMAIWIAAGIYTVDRDESAALERFGALADDAIGPGIHFRLPSGIESVTRVRTGEIFRLEVEGDFLDEVALLTGDENVLEARLVVQYRISRLGDFLYATEDPELLIGQAVKAAMVEAFARSHVDDLLTSAKAEVQNRVREQAQRMLEAYGAGVSMVSVNLQSVNPPPEAAAAFRAVSDSRAMAARLENEAGGEREKSLRLARGEAGRLLEQAGAAAGARREQARGEVERFEHLLARKRLAPGQVRTELYADTVQRVLPRARVIVLAPGEAPRIDVQILRRGGPAEEPPFLEDDGG